MDDRTLDALGLWIGRYAAAAENRRRIAGTIARRAYEQIAREGLWYRRAAIGKIAYETAKSTDAAAQTMAGLASQYIATVLSTITETRISTPRVTLPPPRNGADMVLVYMRPAEAYRRTVGLGGTEQDAQVIALRRAVQLAEGDIGNAERFSHQSALKDRGIKGYRRVLRPELAKPGNATCGLCIAASDNIYRTGNLLPIHPPTCNCVVLPIVGDSDPGHRINKSDLDQLYREAAAAAGKEGQSTLAGDLAKVKYQINEHGEFGPVLTYAKNDFRTESKVPLDKDPERAARMLLQAVPVLDDLQARAASGQDVADPLEYQERFTSRLRSIAEAA